jgi:hypothetical protein
MSKLKIDKIKLQDLSKEEQKEIKGGAPITVTITIGVVSKVITDGSSGCETRQTCYLTCNPGWQDSCGLCTTKYHCPQQ